MADRRHRSDAIRRHIGFDPDRGLLRGPRPQVAPRRARLIEDLGPLLDHLPRVIQTSVAVPKPLGFTHIQDNVTQLRLHLGGSGRIRVAGRILSWSTGDLVRIEAGDEFETLAVGKGGRHLSIHLHMPGRQRSGRHPRLDFLAERLGDRRLLHLGLDHPAAAALQRAHAAHREGALGSDLLASLAVSEALVLLGRSPAPDPSSPPLIAAIQAHIAIHHAREPTIDALLRPYGLHPNYLRGLFKAATGLSIRDYWLRERILAAQKLLVGTASVEAVSQRVGFASSQAFARRFRAITGLSPTQWRAAQAR